MENELKEPEYQSGNEKVLYFNEKRISKKEFKEIRRNRNLFRLGICSISLLISFILNQYLLFVASIFLMLGWRLKRGF